LIDDIPARELFETRMIIEPEIAARAAQRATSGDLASLRQTIIDLERSRTQQERINADAAFHDFIFNASGNRICQLLFKAINRTLLVSMAQTVPRVQVEMPLSFHRKIYTAIRDRNPDEARRLMLAHIADAAEALLDSGK
jgi:GntR family transcriptional repressor for pyruvate dehydrogenase complex